MFHQDKERLIAAMDRELEKIPECSGDFHSRFPIIWKKR